MNGFIIEVEDRPGEVARITEVLAANSVNILPFGVSPLIAFLANNEEAARSALSNANIAFREVPVLFVRAKDEPGEAARLARLLGDAGVNLAFLLPVDTSKNNFTAAVGTLHAEVARQVLGDQIVDWSYS